MNVNIWNSLTVSLLALLVSANICVAQDGPPVFVTHHDKIPNFAYSPTIRSSQNGSWSAASTWNLNRAPNTNDIVAISPGTTVIIDNTTATADSIGIQSSATLKFATNVNTRLKIANMMVQPGATLEIGTTSNPIQANAEIIIKNKPLDLVDDNIGTYDPYQWGTSILALNGTVRMHGAAISPTFVRLATEPTAGGNSLSTAKPVSGWKADDIIVLPDTRHLKWNEHKGNYEPQWEELTLASNPSGNSLSLKFPLQFDHRGAHDPDGKIRYLPHVGNLTRNVTIRSENPNGTRGHMAFTGRSVIDVRYVHIFGLGRTTIALLDNTTEDSNGNITHIGTNQIARYPLHTHHLIGPKQTPQNGYQFTLLGNAIEGAGAQGKIRKWAITIHGSHHGLIKDNVVYNMAGAGITAEDGTETRNMFDHNFVMRIFGNGGRADRDPPGGQGSGFWFRGPNNFIRNNVAANISPNTDTFGYVLFFRYLGDLSMPKFPGADPMVSGEYITRDGNELPLLEFSGNEAYGAISAGATLWWLSTFGDSPRGTESSVIKDFTVWHAYRLGFWNYPVHNLAIDGLTVIGDSSVGGGTGLYMHDYMISNGVVKNADIQGVGVGIYTPVDLPAGNPTIVIRDSYLRNGTNIAVSFLWNCCSQNVNAARIVLRDIQYGAAFGGNSQSNISMNWIPDHQLPWKKADLIERLEVFVINHNRVAGDNFQAYFTQQSPSYILPQTSDNLIGSPVAGLTNAQNWATYGIAAAGAIASCSTKRADINGFSCPFTADTIPPGSPGNLRRP